jgi:hypothetical protein
VPAINQPFFLEVRFDLTVETAFLIAAFFIVPDLGADFTFLLAATRLVSVLAALDLADFVDFGFRSILAALLAATFPGFIGFAIPELLS